jgi:2-iminobutanoate/2-iminopropanoate deaminase
MRLLPRLPRLPAISAILIILLALAGTGQCHGKLEPNFTSNAGVKIYNPSSFFNTTGPWSLLSQAGDSLYIAGALQRRPDSQWQSRHLARTPSPNLALPNQQRIGMRGIHQENSNLAPTGLPRVRLAFENMRDLAGMVGAELTDCVRLVVYTTDM